MMDRGKEVRELKLGATFTNPNARAVFHTLKYDFKPASVDVHKEATLQTGTNNSVTVTLPHLDGSGVPSTVFKGNQREYPKKDCVLIFNRDTNEIILEKLSSQILVKKTRADSSTKPPPSTSSGTANNSSNASSAAGKGENLTTRHSSKTRVSTGVRKNNILNYVPKHSPLQGSPSYPHRSPQQAPLWNANNTQQTLPSIPSLLDDSFANNSQPPSSVYNNNKSNNVNASNNLNTLSASTSMPKASGAIMQQQQQQQQQSQMALDDIGELSSSSSSDSNDDSDSDSDSADSSNNHTMANNNTMMTNNNNSNSNHHKKAPTVSSMDTSTAILRKDLCLSDSNSDSDY